MALYQTPKLVKVKTPELVKIKLTLTANIMIPEDQRLLVEETLQHLKRHYFEPRLTLDLWTMKQKEC